MNEDSLITIQKEVRNRLMADEYFVDIPVYWERTADIVSEIQKALGPLNTRGGKSGVYCMVQQPSAHDKLRGITCGPLAVRVGVLVVENVITNLSTGGTGKAALSVARRIQKTLKLYSSQDLFPPLVPEAECISSVEMEAPLVGYRCNFLAHETIIVGENKVATPTLTLVGAVLTMATTTVGATIYYTTDDDDYPSPTHPEAAQYSAPITLTAVTTVRASAYLQGYIASDVCKGTFTPT